MKLYGSSKRPVNQQGNIKEASSPAEHRHHVQAHLPEDFPVVHLNDLSSNQEQDANGHVTAGEHSLNISSSIINMTHKLLRIFH